jgi:hypothetical protein
MIKQGMSSENKLSSYHFLVLDRAHYRIAIIVSLSPSPSLASANDAENAQILI